MLVKLQMLRSTDTGSAQGIVACLQSSCEHEKEIYTWYAVPRYDCIFLALAGDSTRTTVSVDADVKALARLHPCSAMPVHFDSVSLVTSISRFMPWHATLAVIAC